MKFVLFVFAILVLLWLLKRSLRSLRKPASPPKPAEPGSVQTILECAHCRLHLPRDEALPGRGGVFCSAAHRSAYEQAHPEE